MSDRGLPSRRIDRLAKEIAEVASLGERLAEAARWMLEEGTEEAREALSGAAAAWEVES